MTRPDSALEILLKAFPGIPKNEAQELVALGEIVTYPPEKILCYENAIATTFYIILEGQVKVSKIIDKNQERLLKTLTAGEFFGEMALIYHAPRIATVTTATTTKVLEIRKEAFDRLLQQSASLSLALVREVSRRLRENDAMTIEDLRLRAGELANAHQKLAELEFTRNETMRALSSRLMLSALPVFENLDGLMKMSEDGSPQFQHSVDQFIEQFEQFLTAIDEILRLNHQDLLFPLWTSRSK